MTPSVHLPQIPPLNLTMGEVGRIMVYFPYHLENVSRIKTVPGRRWHPEEKCWSVPHTSDTIAHLQRLFSGPNPKLQRNIPPAKPSRRKGQYTPEEQAFVEPIEQEMRLRGYSPKTRKSYRNHLLRFRRFLQKEPHTAGEKEIRHYLLYLIDEKKISCAHHNQTVSALKFYYQHVLRQPLIVEQLPRPRREKKLPVVLSRREVLCLFDAMANLKHKTLLMLAYSAGLRVSEVVRLNVEDIDSERDLIHIHQAKGRKDRYVPLSEVALEMLRSYWRAYRPQRWLFPGARKDRHLSVRSVQKVLDRARTKAGLLRKHCTMHSLRHNADFRIMPTRLTT